MGGNEVFSMGLGWRARCGLLCAEEGHEMRRQTYRVCGLRDCVVLNR
jgi:hypothetical protein